MKYSIYYEDNVPAVQEQVSEALQLRDVVFQPEQVYEELISLDPNKTAGPDEVKPRVLVFCASELAMPLSILFRKSMETAQLPKDWKMVKITPLYKKGGKKLATNYRPVSLTSQICKVMGRMIW